MSTTGVVSKRTSRLLSLRDTCQAGRKLPPSITALELRTAGFKGNAPAAHWARSALPALRYANPTVSFSRAAKPAEDGAWLKTPGVLVSLAQGQSVFVALESSARKTASVKEVSALFWAAVSSSEALQALPTEQPLREAL